ncbi:MAG: HAD-IC family P-type ATPase [Eubacteriales bacterium]|nr:HAD-IC family P-type ATPase [Eubacteriales bacterium]
MASEHIRKKADFKKAERYAPSPETGLNTSQVELRVSEGYVNYNSTVKTKSVTRIVIGHLMTLFNLVNIVIFIALLWVNSFKNLTFIIVITANVLIGVIQEIRAKKAVDKLSFLSRSPTVVVRDGAETKKDDCEIVLDDVIIYKSGDQVNVDCIVLTGECEANESFVTGESDAVFKSKGDTLLAGSFISSGECRAKADKIADQSYISTISKSAKTIKAGKSVLLTSLKRVITLLSMVIFPLGVFLFIDQLAIHDSVRSAVINTSAALLGMIPQGLMLLTSSALALSVVKLSKKNVLVKDLYSVEMLARVDVVCLDKTGTLTEGCLNVEKLAVMDKSVNCEELLSVLAYSLKGDNATMEAIGEAYPNPPAYKTIKKVPFSSKTKWSGAVLEGKGSVVIGAAEYIMPQNAAVLEEVRRYSDDYRVLLLCTSPDGMEHGILSNNLKPAALVLLRDKIRREAAQLIRYLTEQDVKIKIISGDNPVTVSAIARGVGVPDAERYIDCSQINSDKELKKAACEYTVFGRVTPFQKKLLVLALKKKKHTVAMTGDGVNDVLAMKEADCSVAMGSGTDAARNVSKLVLLRSDFSCLPAVIAEGRRSINNIQRSASFFLVKTVYAALMAFLFLLLHKPYPFQPIQQSLISFACIGFPSVVLALEPNKDRIKGSFFGNVILRALPGGLTITAAVTLTACLNSIADHIDTVGWLSWASVHINHTHIPTMVLFITGFISYLVLISICYPPNKLGKTLMAVVALLFIGGVVFLRNWFEIAALSFKSIAVTVLICALSGVMMYVLTRISRRILYGKRTAHTTEADLLEK